METLFAAIPQLVAAYVWDAEDGVFLGALRGDPGLGGRLETLTPGMGLWLYIDGSEGVRWTRDFQPESGRVSVLEGWNLVAWGGGDKTSAVEALESQEERFSEVWGWDSEQQQLIRYNPARQSAAGGVLFLRRGDGLWVRSSSEARWLQSEQPRPLPSVTRVQFFGDFTEDQRVRYEEAIRAELEHTARFFRGRYGLVTPDLEFRLSTRDVPEDLGFAYGGGVIYLRQDRIEPTVEELVGGTVTWSVPEFNFLDFLAHEYVHALQDATGSFGGPFWIQEGMAWYLDALHDRTRAEPDRFKSREELLWAARGSTVALPMMERSNWHWGLGYVATERLVERSSEEALFDFYKHLGSGYDSWHGAFGAAFGMTVDAFYEDFAAWRVREAPPQSFFSGVVVDPDGNPVEGITVIALRTWSFDRETGERTFSSWIELSRDDGTFDVRARPSVESVIVLTTGECSDVGLLAEDGGLTQDGDKARRFAIDLEGVSDITIVLPGTREELCTSETSHRWDALRALGWIE